MMLKREKIEGKTNSWKVAKYQTCIDKEKSAEGWREVAKTAKIDNMLVKVIGHE